MSLKKTTPPNNSRSKFTREDLIEQIITLQIEKSWPRRQILQYIQKEMNYSESESYRIMVDVNEKISQIWNQNTAKNFENAIATLEQQKINALEDGDKKLALEITKEINKIQGLYIERIKVDATVEYVAKFGEGQ